VDKSVKVLYVQVNLLCFKNCLEKHILRNFKNIILIVRLLKDLFLLATLVEQ